MLTYVKCKRVCNDSTVALEIVQPRFTYVRCPLKIFNGIAKFNFLIMQFHFYVIQFPHVYWNAAKNLIVVM